MAARTDAELISDIATLNTGGANTAAEVRTVFTNVKDSMKVWREDTAANFTSGNPTLADNEVGLETDTGLFKIGDGTTAWTSLAYANQDTGGVTDGDKGDITVTASGATWTIDAAAVTLAKMADLAQATVIGRAVGAGTGVPVALTAAQLRAIANVEDGADVTDVINVGAAGAPIITSGAGAPTSTPGKAGDVYIDTTAKTGYVATGNASSADWDQMSDEAGTNIISSGAGAPGTTPGGLGYIYVDTTADLIYMATDTVSAADWKKVITEDGATTAPTASFASGDWLFFGDITDSDNVKKITGANFITDNALAVLGGNTFTGALQFSGTGHEGIRLNSLTTTQRDALTAVAGMIIFNSTTNNIEGYDGTSWVDLTAAGGGSAIEVIDESTSLTTAVTKFTFVGAGVTATEPVADEVTVTIPGAGGGSGTVLDYFTALNARAGDADYATLDTILTTSADEQDSIVHVLDFPDGATETFTYFFGVMPDNYTGGGITLTIYWLSTATTGDVIWSAAFKSMTPGADNLLTKAFAAENDSAASTTAGTARVLNSTTITFTDGADMDSVAAGEPYSIELRRSSNDGGDTMAADAEFFALKVSET